MIGCGVGVQIYLIDAIRHHSFLLIWYQMKAPSHWLACNKCTRNTLMFTIVPCGPESLNSLLLSHYSLTLHHLSSVVEYEGWVGPKEGRFWLHGGRDGKGEQLEQPGGRLLPQVWYGHIQRAGGPVDQPLETHPHPDWLQVCSQPHVTYTNKWPHTLNAWTIHGSCVCVCVCVWPCVLSSSRLKDLEFYVPELQQYKNHSTALNEWIDSTQKRQKALQSTKTEDLEAFILHISQQKVFHLLILWSRTWVSIIRNATWPKGTSFAFSRHWILRSRRREGH